MAQLQGVNVEQLQGGLNRLALNTDNHFAYFDPNLINADIPEGVIRSVFEAEQMGINASFDANMDANVYSGIQDFFRLAPEGVLYLSFRNDLSEMADYIRANEAIKGYAFKSFAGFFNLTENQSMINEFKSENRLIDFAILAEDYAFYFDDYLFDYDAPNVSVCIASDDASGKATPLTLLGMLAARQVSENLGSVDILNKPLSKRGRLDYPLTDTVLGRWTKAYLTNGADVSTMPQGDLNNLKSRGYIMAASYEGYPGYFFENSYTCIDRSSDFAFIENNRVWNKAARIVRATLIPRVKSKVKKDPQTGFIAATTTSYWESLISNALEQQMVNTNDLSGFEVFIDNKQVVNDTNPVKIKLRLVMDDIAHEFEVAIGLTNNLA